MTPVVLHQDFISARISAQPLPACSVQMAAPDCRLEPAPQPWNSMGFALIGLAILPGLWLSYLGLSAGSLPHQKLLLLGLELLLIGLQLFCFSLVMVLLLETHQSFPKTRY